MPHGILQSREALIFVMKLYLYKLTQLVDHEIGMGILCQFNFPYIVVPFTKVCFLITENSPEDEIVPKTISFRRDTQKPEIVLISPLGTGKEITLSKVDNDFSYQFYANIPFEERIKEVSMTKKNSFVSIIVQNIVNSFRHEIESERH